MPDSPSFDLTGPETRGVPFDELSNLSEKYPGLRQLLDSPIHTTKPSPVILFTGAGASKPLGMPTMLEFNDNYSKKLCGKVATLWNNVVNSSAEFFNTKADSIDLEQVLTYIDDCELSYCNSASMWEKMYGVYLGTPTIEQIHDFRQDLWSLRNDMLDQICATYGAPDPSSVVECYGPLFWMLKSVSGQVSTNVFTTNYDLSLEVLSKTKPDDFILVDGFVILSSGEEVYKKQYVPTFNGGHVIVLWKLHGSTSWRGKAPYLELVKAPPGKYIGADGKRTVIIYPTKDKDASQNLHASPFNQAYGGFESMFSQIQATQVLLVIGYRFGDIEINDVIEKGLALEGNAKVIVVDPNATLESVAGLFPKIDQGRIKVIPHKFGEEGTIGKIEEEVRSSIGNC